MPDKMNERVLCFESSLLDQLGRFQGVSTEPERYFPLIVTPPNCSYVLRREAEKNEAYKQIIPYVLFVNDTDIFCYRRGKRGSEERLREKYSVGIGGHIEVDDRLLFSKDEIGYYDATWREVTEEVTLDADLDTHDPATAPCVGLINDDSNPVGRVHFGVIHLISVRANSVSKNESVITDSGFVPIEKAQQDSERYETWSQLCLKHIDLLLAAARAPRVVA